MKKVFVYTATNTIRVGAEEFIYTEGEVLCYKDNKLVADFNVHNIVGVVVEEVTEEESLLAKCEDCAWRDDLSNWCMNPKGLNREVFRTDYCVKGKRE